MGTWTRIWIKKKIKALSMGLVGKVGVGGDSEYEAEALLRGVLINKSLK